MVIHFDFIVEDADGENIFDCIRDRIESTRELMIEAKINNRTNEAKWLEDSIQYYEDLLDKMKNHQEP